MVDEWYLIRHDDMLALAEARGFTKTISWIDAGTYNLPRPSKAILALCAPYKFARLEDVAIEAAGSA